MMAKNGTLFFPDSSMEYIRFGSGPRVLVILPGLGDGLRTVRGTALPMAAMYRIFSREFTVYAFSRKEPVTENATTRDMARDVKQALDALGIQKISLFGVSMGGMIAQHFAADYPETLEKLVLCVTAPCPNPLLTESVTEWVNLAASGNHAAFLDSNLRRIYSDKYCRKTRWMIPLIGRLTKPRNYDRFFRLAQSCLTHDAADRLFAISCPVLVVGGGKDVCLGVEASREIAKNIPNSRLHIYPGWGHGLYEEAPDFNRLVFDFLR